MPDWLDQLTAGVLLAERDHDDDGPLGDAPDVP